MKLENISEIQTGLVLARKRAYAKDEQPIQCKLLTLKSFDSVAGLDLAALNTFVSNSQLEEKYLTKKGDVVIRLTSPYTALVIESNAVGIVVPSNFVVIRLKDKSFHPEYVALYLNSKKMNKLFQQSSISVTIPLIKTSFLRNVNIVEKPIDSQKKIVELNKLLQKEGMLLNQLNKEKKKLAQTCISKIIMGEDNHGKKG